MVRVKKKIKAGKASVKRAKLRAAYDGLNGNAMITAPTNPTLPNYLLKLQAIDAKLIEISEAETELGMLREQRDQLFQDAELMYAQLGSHVETVAGDDRAIAESSGFDLVDESPSTPPPLAKLTDVSASTGDDEGGMDVQWNPDSTADAYEVQTSPDPITATSWVHGATIGVSKLTLEGLPHMAKRWARVRPVRGGETGPWSDPACAVIA